MTTRTTHDLSDTNHDGIFDSAYHVTETRNSSGDLEYRIEYRDSDNNGVPEWASYEANAWSGDKLAFTDRGFDPGTNGAVDGVFEQTSHQDYVYNAKGQLIRDVVSLPDMNGDGQADWATYTDRTYDKKGNVTQVYTSYTQDGVVSPYEYRLEQYQYDNKGHLIERFIDDPIAYDFDVKDRWTYDNKGRLTSQSHSDPFDYGDDAFHVEKTISYDKFGRVDKVWEYDEVLDGKHVASVNTKFVYHNANWYAEYQDGYDFNGNLVARVLDEHWSRPVDGQETHELISYDRNFDGRWDSGTRDLVLTQYFPDGTVQSVTTDLTTGDGIIEHLLITDPVIA